MTRRTLARVGVHGASARVFVEGEHVRVTWYQEGTRHQESWRDTPAARTEAKAYAQGVADRLAENTPTTRLTVRELFARYLESRTELRPRTLRQRRDYWHKWELLVGRDTPADDLTAEALDRLRLGLQKAGLAPRTIGEAIATVKNVYAWGDQLELVRDRVHRYRYRIAKEERRDSPDEFDVVEFRRLVAAIDPVESWRALGVLLICGLQGARQWAVLHLQWRDVDLDARKVAWEARWDKNGIRKVHRLREPTIVALRAIQAAQTRYGISSPWVFPKGNNRNTGDVYTAGALWRALCAAEKKAGIPHRPGRGAHGLRRLLAGQVYALTLDLKLAGEAIGDTDLRSIRRYLKPQEGQITTVFDQLDATPGGPDD